MWCKFDRKNDCIARGDIVKAKPYSGRVSAHRADILYRHRKGQWWAELSSGMTVLLDKDCITEIWKDDDYYIRRKKMIYPNPRNV